MKRHLAAGLAYLSISTLIGCTSPHPLTASPNSTERQSADSGSTRLATIRGKLGPALRTSTTLLRIDGQRAYRNQLRVAPGTHHLDALAHIDIFCSVSKPRSVWSNRQSLSFVAAPNHEYALRADANLHLRVEDVRTGDVVSNWHAGNLCLACAHPLLGLSTDESGRGTCPRCSRPFRLSDFRPATASRIPE